MLTQDKLETLVESVSIFNLDVSLIKAIIEKESSWNPYAWNPEPKYKYLVNVLTGQPFRQLTPEETNSEKPPNDFHCFAGDKDQEWWAQQSSWGLMQLMGGAARERGFKGPYLTELLDPEINIQYGCRHFLTKLKSVNGDITQALLRWNGGGNLNYAKEVLEIQKKYI